MITDWRALSCHGLCGHIVLLSSLSLWQCIWKQFWLDMPVQCSQMSDVVFFLVPDIRCTIQVAYSNNHKPISLSSPGATSTIPRFECYNHRSLEKPVWWSDKQYMSKLRSLQGMIQPTTGASSTASTVIHEVRKRGEQKIFLHVRFLFFFSPVPPPCPLSWFWSGNVR